MASAACPKNLQGQYAECFALLNELILSTQLTGVIPTGEVEAAADGASKLAAVQRPPRLLQQVRSKPTAETTVHKVAAPVAADARQSANTEAQAKSNPTAAKASHKLAAPEGAVAAVARQPARQIAPVAHVRQVATPAAQAKVPAAVAPNGVKRVASTPGQLPQPSALDSGKCEASSNGGKDVDQLKARIDALHKKRDALLSQAKALAPAPRVPAKAGEQATVPTQDLTMDEHLDFLDDMLMSGLHAALGAERQVETHAQEEKRRGRELLATAPAAPPPFVSPAVRALSAGAAKGISKGMTNASAKAASAVVSTAASSSKGRRPGIPVAVSASAPPGSKASAVAVSASAPPGSKASAPSHKAKTLLNEDENEDCDFEDGDLLAGFQALLGAQASDSSVCENLEKEQEEEETLPAEEEEEPPSKRRRTFDPAKIADVSSIHKRWMYLMRGPPGCGKSTAARALLEHHLKAQGFAGNIDENSPLCRAFIFSTDDYFTSVDEEDGSAKYNFDPRALSRNHQRNLQRCTVACELAITPIIADNTFSALWEMKAYIKLAESHGYGVRIIDPLTVNEDAFDIDTLVAHCEERCSKTGKSIGRDVLERMVDRFQFLPDDTDEAISAIRVAR